MKDKLLQYQVKWGIDTFRLILENARPLFLGESLGMRVCE